MNDTPTEPGAERHSPGRWLLAAVALLLVVGLATTIALALPRMEAARKGQTVVLPSGGQVELLGTTAGGATFSTDKPWMALARKILPAPLRHWLPAEFSGSVGSVNGLTVWLRFSTPGPGTPINWGGTITEDETGFRYAGGNGYGSFISSQITGLDLHAYPRRQKDFLLHLVDMRGAIIATLRVPNPNWGPFPVWQPLPLPQILTNGPVTLTLSKLEQRRAKDNSLYVGGAWNIESRTPGWSNASVRYWTFIDATGNEGQYLSPRESAWKVGAQVMRPKTADFAPNEKLILTNLAVPVAGHFTLIDGKNRAAGVTIVAWALCGPGCLAITNGIIQGMGPPLIGRLGHWVSTIHNGSSDRDPPIHLEEWEATNSFFLVNMANVQRGEEIQFYLRDNRGRDVKIEANSWETTPTGGRVYQPTFAAPPDAESVTLEIVVNRPLEFGFLVDPKDVQAAPAP